MSLLPINPISLPASLEGLSTVGASGSGGDFVKALRSAISQVETSNAQANKAVDGYLSGANQELHSTILAVQSAELNFDMFLQVRNKVVSAYEEMMKMQV
jgi:flagellar hook-basal body complex protein FliE